MERLQKVIANNGVCSRRKAEELINAGKVLVNGEKAHLGDKVDYNDVISINNEIIKMNREDKVYYLLNKPRGVVCTSSDELNRKTVVELINTDKRIYPVGRLDYDTTGAIILTNDGELTNLLTHPKRNVEKVYLAKLSGIITGVEINKLKDGVLISDENGKKFKTSKARVKLKKYDKKTNSSMVEVTIHEGHNHQVKKMFESVGFLVDKLTRVRFAFLDVKNLKSGEYRELSVKEVKQLYGLTK